MKCCGRRMLVMVLFFAHSYATAEEAARTASKSVQNANFVVTAPTRELAAAIMSRAELLRDEIALDWLGDRLPPSIGNTVIYVKLAEGEDCGRTWPNDDPRRLSFMMWLTTTQQGATGPLLEHEMTHVVLETRYPGQLPPWANEGIASLKDGARRQAIQGDVLAWYVQTGNWPDVAEVLNAEKIFSTNQASYAVATSLVRFFLARSDRPQLLEFSIEGNRAGVGDRTAAPLFNPRCRCVANAMADLGNSNGNEVHRCGHRS